MLKRDAETNGLEFLKAHQNEDGSWQSPKEPPGITAIVVKAFVQDPKHNLRDPFLAKALERLKSYQNADGSVAEMLVTYNTAITVSAMAAPHDPALKESIAKAIAYLRSTEWTDKIEGINEKDPAYGGWGYTKKSRPDLSNVQTAIDALRDAGLKSDDPAFQTALKFITVHKTTPKRTIGPGPATMAVSFILRQMADRQPPANRPDSAGWKAGRCSQRRSACFNCRKPSRT